MPSSLLKILALLPIPAIIIGVYFAGRRAEPPAAKAPEKQAVPEGEARLPEQPASGWQAVGTIKRFDKKTLFDRINGAAPPYIDAGFRYSLGGEYRKAGAKEPVTVDAYDMGTAVRAFGMYGRERDPSYSFIEVGDEGYLASGSLNFWRGRFYVKLAALGEEGEATDKQLRELGAALAKALPAEADAVKQTRAALALLPAEHRMARGDGYSLKPLDGIAGLAEAYSARYRVDGKEDGAEYRLAIVPLKRSASDARLAQVKQHLAKEGGEGKLGEVKVKVGEQEQPALQLASEGSTSFYATTARGLVAGLDLPDKATAQAVLQRLLAAMAKDAQDK